MCVEICSKNDDHDHEFIFFNKKGIHTFTLFRVDLRPTFVSSPAQNRRDTASMASHKDEELSLFRHTIQEKTVHYRQTVHTALADTRP